MVEPLKYDPRLRAAMAEWQAICKKYDIGGYCILTSDTHAEFAYEISPSWSVIAFDEGRRERLTYRHRGSSPEGKEKSNATSHMIFITRDLLAKGWMAYESICSSLELKLGVDHKNRTFDAPDAVP